MKSREIMGYFPSLIAMPRKIAFIDLTFNWPPVGGCWVDLKEIMSRLPAFGYETKLFVPDWQDYYPRGRVTEELPFPVEKIPFNRFTYNTRTVRQRFRKKIEEYAPDVVFVGDGYFMKGALLPALRDWPLILRIYSYELVCINLHYYLYHQEKVCDGSFLTDPRRCHTCWYSRRMTLAKHLAGILAGIEDRHPKLHFSQEYLFSLAFTNYYRSRLQKWLSIPSTIVVYNDFAKSFFQPHNPNIEVIPSGIDTSSFTPGEPRRSDGPLSILMTGRINDPLKGFPTAKQACDTLHQEGRDFRLQITSAFDFDDMGIPYLQNLGWRPPEQLPELYRQADIALVPSTWIEPFGITALEAMASGLPVIASRIGGLAHSIVDGETGILVEPGQPQGLRDALIQLMDNPDKRNSMGRAGRDRAVREFDWNVIVKNRYLPILEKILD